MKRELVSLAFAASLLGCGAGVYDRDDLYKEYPGVEAPMIFASGRRARVQARITELSGGAVRLKEIVLSDKRARVVTFSPDGREVLRFEASEGAPWPKEFDRREKGTLDDAARDAFTFEEAALDRIHALAKASLDRLVLAAKLSGRVSRVHEVLIRKEAGGVITSITWAESRTRATVVFDARGKVISEKIETI